jgi:hypothetical protein
MQAATLSISNNGFACIETSSYLASWKICLLLMFRYGFRREGKVVPPITDQAIYKDYVKDELRILSGWDNLRGYDWLANDLRSDMFLRDFYERHCR